MVRTKKQRIEVNLDPAQETTVDSLSTNWRPEAYPTSNSIRFTCSAGTDTKETKALATSRFLYTFCSCRDVYECYDVKTWLWVMTTNEWTKLLMNVSNPGQEKASLYFFV